jgi:hypothetical protein
METVGDSDSVCRSPLGVRDDEAVVVGDAARDALNVIAAVPVASIVWLEVLDKVGLSDREGVCFVPAPVTVMSADGCVIVVLRPV